MKRLIVLGLVYAFLVSCSTSTEPDELTTGTAVFSIDIPLELQGFIVTVEAVVSAADMDTLRENLSIIGDTLATGTVDNIPVGNDRLFTLNAYKSGGLKSHTGSTVADVLTDTTKVHVTLIPIISTAVITGVFSQDYALEFDGVDDYAVAENYTFPSQLTIEAWFKTASSANGADWGIAGDYLVPNGALLHVGAHLAFTVNDSHARGTTVPQPDTWYHIAGTYDGQQMKLYVNGMLDTTVAQTGAPVTPNGRFQFGGYNLQAKYSFPGVIDEVRVWSYARSQLEIQSAMYVMLQGNETGLVNCWRLNAGRGQTLTDVAGAADGRLGSTISEDNNDPVWVLSDRPRHL